MTLIRTGRRDAAQRAELVPASQTLKITHHDVPCTLTEPPSLEQTVRAWHQAGHSQRAIACQLSIDRRKIKRILDQTHNSGSARRCVSGLPIMLGIAPLRLWCIHFSRQTGYRANNLL
jgi:hypothetical protein